MTIPKEVKVTLVGGRTTDVVTQKNYREIKGYLEDKIEHFLLNSENWILVLFKKLPAEASEESIRDFNEWINKYLSQKDIQTIISLFSMPA